MDALTRFKSGHSRPPAAPADDGDDWDVVIARAHMRAALLEAQRTPLPRPLPPARARVPERTKATLDALMRGGLHSPASLRPALVARRPSLGPARRP